MGILPNYDNKYRVEKTVEEKEKEPFLMKEKNSVWGIMKLRCLQTFSCHHSRINVRINIFISKYLKYKGNT